MDINLASFWQWRRSQRIFEKIIQKLKPGKIVNFEENNSEGNYGESLTVRLLVCQARPKAKRRIYKIWEKTLEVKKLLRTEYRRISKAKEALMFHLFTMMSRNLKFINKVANFNKSLRRWLAIFSTKVQDRLAYFIKSLVVSIEFQLKFKIGKQSTKTFEKKIHQNRLQTTHKHTDRALILKQRWN